MLTRLTVRNFKRFKETDIELGNPVVFIGPNNSGKTTALQALSLWHTGVRRWQEKRAGEEAPEKRPGVTINRRDLLAVPVPDAKLLWRNLDVREVQRLNGKRTTQNIRLDVTVEGVSGERKWSCGLEFDYANEESFYCRPLRSQSGRMPVPPEAAQTKLAFLPPMSGLSAQEPRLDVGFIGVRIGGSNARDPRKTGRDRRGCREGEAGPTGRVSLYISSARFSMVRRSPPVMYSACMRMRGSASRMNFSAAGVRAASFPA